MATYRLDILVTAKDRASGTLGGVHGALSRILYVATGVLIAQAIRSVTEFFSNIIGGAFEAHGRLEKLGVALETLVAVEISRGQIVEETSTHVRHLRDEEILQLDRLRVEYFDLEQTLGDLQDEYADVTAEHGQQSIEALRVSVAIRETQMAMEDLGGEIERISGLEGALITTTEKVRVGQLSMNEAMRLAAGPAKDLLNWVTQLALVSPFEEEDVFTTFNQAAGFGFATQYASELTDEQARLKKAQDNGVVTAQRLTYALLDMAAVFPAVADGLPRIVKGLGDMKAAGKVLALDLRQLYNAGIRLDFMAYAMGLTVQEFEALRAEGLAADDFILALVETIETDFAGASDRMLETLYGLRLGFAELGPIMGREFIDPLIQELIPGMIDLFNVLSSPEALESARRRGERFRDVILEIFDIAQRVRDFFKSPIEITFEVLKLPDLFTETEERRITLGIQNFFRDVFGSIIPPDVQQMISGQISTLFDQVAGAVIQAQEENFGLRDPEAGTQAGLGVLGGILGLSGLASALTPGSTFMKAVTGGIGLILTIVGKLIGRIGWVGLAISALATAWAGDWLGIRTATMEAWEETIKPFLMDDLPRILTEDLPRAVGEFKTWWEEDIVTPIRTGFEEDIQPAVQRFIDEGLVNLGVASDTLGDQLREGILTPLQIVRDILIGENGLIPGIVGFVEGVGQNAGSIFESIFGPMVMDNVILDGLRFFIFDFIPAVSSFWMSLRSDEASVLFTLADNVLRPIAETFLELGQTLFENVLDRVSTFIGFIQTIREDSAEAFMTAYEGFFKPVLEGLWELWEDHVVPLTQSFVDLVGEIIRIASELFRYAWKQHMEPIWIGTRDFLEEHINPLFDGLVGLLEDVWDFWIGQRLSEIQWVIDHVLPALRGAFEGIAGVLDGLKGLLDDIISRLQNIHIPDPVEEHSPSKMTRAFMSVAEAIEQVNDAYNESPLFNRVGTMRFAGMNAGGTMPPVYLQGDSNTFYVPDRSVADYLAHQLNEMKKKRFSRFMGRAT